MPIHPPPDFPTLSVNDATLPSVGRVPYSTIAPLLETLASHVPIHPEFDRSIRGLQRNSYFAITASTTTDADFLDFINTENPRAISLMRTNIKLLRIRVLSYQGDPRWRPNSDYPIESGSRMTDFGNGYSNIMTPLPSTTEIIFPTFDLVFGTDTIELDLAYRITS